MTGDPAPAPAAPPAARPKGWLLGYPTDHLMGVLPSPAAADAAIAELERAGIDHDAIRILVGEEAALRIDGRGTHHGLVARLYRLVQFTQMDQAPDFRRYEREARRGHPVVAVKETDPARRNPGGAARPWRALHQLLRPLLHRDARPVHGA
jgi:hypothetical protein